MAKLGELTERIRSKNAGPFWLTIDIFCRDGEELKQVSESLSNECVANLFGQPVNHVKRFELPDLAVLKFSLPRPTVQGSLRDRDMHASQYGWLLAELEINGCTA